MCNFMSSFTTEPLDPIVEFNIESILANQLFAQEYSEIALMEKYSSEALLFENMVLNLNYDMGRYMDFTFIKARPFYSSSAINFNDFLRDIINEIGASQELNEYHSHLSFLFGAFHKKYNLLLANDL